ncbi:MAG: hypothetical protein P4L31_03945 [Candidatus Babeliales bacterium]|nr:hypothetical protein [Candidatus Babeliales bacterium]
MIKKGFSLIECMVYSFLFILLTTMLFGWLSAVQSRAMRTNKDDSLGVECAFDMFSRDVRMAPSAPELWKKITKHELIWHTDKHDVCWRLAKNGKSQAWELFRIEGNYSMYNDTWIKKSKSLIVKDIQDLIFDVRLDEYDQVFQVEYTCDKKVYSVTVRNRRIL